MTAVEFVVAGKPVPKGRPRVVGRGRNRHAYTPKKTLDWESAIRSAAREAANGVSFPQGMPLSVTVRMTVGGLSVRVEASPFLYSRGDGDNYLKAVLDGLQDRKYERGIMRDDRQVAELHFYGRPGASDSGSGTPSAGNSSKRKHPVLGKPYPEKSSRPRSSRTTGKALTKETGS